MKVRACTAENLSVSAARARLSIAARRAQRRKPISADGKYYGELARKEEVIRDLGCAPVVDAMVTRNYYGSLVLNSARTLFIDVDMMHAGESVPATDLCCHSWRGAWRTTLDDIRTVLASERDAGFRIYRTAAGFRILATTREYGPGTPTAERLMNIVGADAKFMKLCRFKRNFRARLTPKPWRCGLEKPPEMYPRYPAGDPCRFADWLVGYERACGDRATCQYLEHVGVNGIHERVGPVIELHDRITKASQSLALA